MRTTTPFPAFLFIILSGLLASCEIDNEIEEISKDPEFSKKKVELKKPLPAPKRFLALDTEKLAEDSIRENLRNSLRIHALDDESCLPSELTPILLQHLAKLASDPLAEDYFNLYTNLSLMMATSDRSEQYFGAEGEYTSLMNRRIRELERFWNMPGALRVNGQHSESLNDREKLATLYFMLSQDESSWEMAYEAADEILALNAQSLMLPESIFFSLDGLLNFANTIVIGDGLVQVLSETGIDPRVIYSSILSHEWAHQIQLDHFESWYPGVNPYGADRPGLQLELEADFFSAYFLTHKRGAAYNWKRIEEFLDLSFTLGDCSTTSPLHHGTPAQRMRASRLGYELAMAAQKKGHILTPEEVHQAFVQALPEILQP